MNIGAQKCVIQRVRNSAGSATSRGFMPPAPKKSRVWSSAITTMTAPRSRSIESMRGRAPALGTDADRLSPLALGDSFKTSNDRLMTRPLLMRRHCPLEVPYVAIPAVRFTAIGNKIVRRHRLRLDCLFLQPIRREGCSLGNSARLDPSVWLNGSRALATLREEWRRAAEAPAASVICHKENHDEQQPRRPSK